MNEEEINVLYNEILKLPKVDKPITASAMCELSVNELMDTLRVFRHIPEYSELMHSNCEKDKEIERLNNIIKAKDEGIKAFTEDLCEESTKIEKAIDYINKRKQERENANKYAYDIRNDDFIKYCNIELDILKGSDK